MNAVVQATQKRAPRPFAPRTVVIERRGARWRITVRRFWSIPVTEDREPDALCWSAERAPGSSPWAFVPVRGDDVPASVARQAAALHQQCVADDTPESVRSQPSLF